MKKRKNLGARAIKAAKNATSQNEKTQQSVGHRRAEKIELSEDSGMHLVGF